MIEFLISHTLIILHRAPNSLNIRVLFFLFLIKQLSVTYFMSDLMRKSPTAEN